MLKKRTGMSQEPALPKESSIFVPKKKAEISEKTTAEAWNALAEKWVERYSEHGDLNREHIIDPTMLHIMGPVKNLSVLDAGCGGGYFSRLLTKKGARVVGVDISQRLIEIAKQKENEERLGIKYYVCSLCNLAMLQDEMFDIVVSNLVLMDVTDLDEAMIELHRVLKREGKLVFSIMHPCFSSPPIHGWLREPRDSQREEDWLHWKVDRYFERGMETWWLYDWPAVFSFHRPLSDYMKALFARGFIITSFEEPVPSKKAVREHHRELSDSERVPWFLVLGATKQ
jgi:2-polyprenyl-3-methyl-5-hydroxy-6-metoxy-1,4-benzoquinol methylase